MAYDVVIIGGGHNGLVAAGYLAKSGLKVLLLEKLAELGGAAVSEYAFPGLDAKLSRYSYLVSLLPEQIILDLDLDITLAPRRYGSYTPEPGSDRGLLIDKQDPKVTAESFASIDATEDFAAWNSFYDRTEQLAKKLFPTVLEPLRTQSEVRELIGGELWQEFFEDPIGKSIRSNFHSDLVRGVVLTDALIGTFASNEDANLDANKCFLYHVIGNETGEWQIPVGGMGSVTKAMAKRAKALGALLETNCEVISISEDRTVTYLQNGEKKTVSGKYLLVNVAEPVLEKLLGHKGEHNIQGAQVKVNMLLKRLPKLKSNLEPEKAFGGTFHINENYSQLQDAFAQAASGQIPNPLPLEIYCHSLTDPSILGKDLQDSGAQTLTAFALHTPHSLLATGDHDQMRRLFEEAVLNSINSVLAEDIRDLLLIDQYGDVCIETKTTLDLENSLGLPGGNIFHAPLSWPFAKDDEELNSPEKRWGVASGYPNVFYCGSTARRGGAVSGIAGHNAAMAILELINEPSN